MKRRNFLSMLAAAFVADPERLLWRPGAKLISIPPAKVHTPSLDEINAITLQYLRPRALIDNFFVNDPVIFRLKAHWSVAQNPDSWD